jgi:NADH-quinone oxidoreductase subunit F
MNQYSQNCFENCWHCAERPCPHFVDCVNIGQRCDCSEHSGQSLVRYKDQLLMVEHDLPVILVGMGTCGLANGARRILEGLKAELFERGISASVIPVGCVGYCAREVIVDVKLPGRPRISYCEVKEKDILPHRRAHNNRWANNRGKAARYVCSSGRRVLGVSSAAE